MPEVTVVMPLYGDHQGRAGLAGVAAAWLAQDVPCEVVVATAGDLDVDLPGGRVIRADPEIRSAGVLRNIAAAAARSPLLCLTDTDVLPLGRDYLRRALRLADGAALAQPWMYRLPGGAPALARTGVPEPVGIRVAAPAGRVCYVTGAPGPVLVPHTGERLERDMLGAGSLRMSTPMVWPPPAAYVFGLPEHMQRQPPFHWGQLLLPAEWFAQVGGYCTAYTGWGCEDDDLLVKVASRAPLIRGWHTEASLACLHLEHPRHYVAGPDWRANRARLRERMAAGPEAMIEEDLRSGPGAGLGGYQGRRSARTTAEPGAGSRGATGPDRL
ncbi:glycosyltransferase family 2 protein [Streptomyces roseoverticillatus]|uniref:glycosyltransferase family 2 protein n=1 Tax=Streptomyces roseoverticillatus TaxID=66429 RepID=UPI0004BF70AA|nr:glycosyltransferase family 2 protein [Streptomyces roseoverticillatus]